MTGTNIFTEVAAILADHRPALIAETTCARAAVAMLLRPGEDAIELLFMERASRQDDPWSGNIGFPGGRVEVGDITPQRTAERETMEEIGLDLSGCDYLGRLSDIVGAHLPVQVSCYVYGVTGTPCFRPNQEVGDLFWVSLCELSDPDRQVEARVRFGGEDFIRPAIRLPQEEKPLLWGITYRLTMELLLLLREAGTLDCGASRYRQHP